MKFYQTKHIAKAVAHSSEEKNSQTFIDINTGLNLPVYIGINTVFNILIAP